MGAPIPRKSLDHEANRRMSQEKDYLNIRVESNSIEGPIIPRKIGYWSMTTWLTNNGGYINTWAKYKYRVENAALKKSKNLNMMGTISHQKFERNWSRKKWDQD